MEKVLIVVDMQNDFIDGSLGTPEAQAIVPKVVEKIKEYIDNNWFIYTTQDTHSENYLKTPEGLKLPVRHCIYDTCGWDINDDIREALEYDLYSSYAHQYKKRTFGCKELVEELVRYDEEQAAIDEIELVGLCTGICVMSNAIMLKNAFYDKFTEITVDASCCACVTPESHKHALKAMKLCQINVIGE